MRCIGSAMHTCPCIVFQYTKHTASKKPNRQSKKKITCSATPASQRVLAVRISCKRVLLMAAATVVPSCVGFSWTNVLKRATRTVLESGSAVSIFLSDSKNGGESPRTGIFCGCLALTTLFFCCLALTTLALSHACTWGHFWCV